MYKKLRKENSEANDNTVAVSGQKTPADTAKPSVNYDDFATKQHVKTVAGKLADIVDEALGNFQTKIDDHEKRIGTLEAQLQNVLQTKQPSPVAASQSESTSATSSDRIADEVLKRIRGESSSYGGNMSSSSSICITINGCAGRHINVSID